MRITMADVSPSEPPSLPMARLASGDVTCSNFMRPSGVAMVAASMPSPMSGSAKLGPRGDPDAEHPPDERHPHRHPGGQAESQQDSGDQGGAVAPGAGFPPGGFG